MLTAASLASWNFLAAANDFSALETAIHVDSSSEYWVRTWLRGSALLPGRKMGVEMVQVVPPAASSKGQRQPVGEGLCAVLQESPKPSRFTDPPLKTDGPAQRTRMFRD